MKVLICDSEPAVRRHLVALVQSLGHEIVAQADRPEEALTMVMVHQPEAMLISAHAPYVEEFCHKIHREFEHPPALIFSGLDDAYPILTALRLGASDYLQIPIKTQDLAGAFAKCQRINAAQQAVIDKDAGRPSRPRQYIAARTHRGVELISVADVYYFTADQKYVKVRHKNGVVLIDETLKDLETEFLGVMFRIHRNALINIEYLDVLSAVDGGQYQVAFRGIPERLAVSRRHLPALRERIHRI